MRTYDKIKITINGRALSKDNEKCFNRASGRPFTSLKFKDYAVNVAYEAKSQMNRAGWHMFDIPIKVKMTFYFSTDTRLDLFNAPKSICDALNKIVWKDDRLIHQGYLVIGYADRERVEIEVEPAYLGDEAFTVPERTPKSVQKSIRKAAIEGGFAFQALG